jgi:hypothetical protein
MTRSIKIAVVFLAAGAFAGAVFCELVLDVRTPASTLESRHMVSSSAGFDLAEVKRRSLELQQIYGADAHTTIGPQGLLTTKLDNKVVHTESMPGNFAEVYGLFAVGSRELRAAIFPYELGPDQDPKSSRHSLTRELKSALRNSPGAQRFVQFEDSDWDLGPCTKSAASELGLGPLGDWLGFKNGVACVIKWMGSRPATMLINVSVAQGNPLLRPFISWLCRTTTATTLDRVAPPGSSAPDYAACIFINRSKQNIGRQFIFVRTYEIRSDRKFALISR